jgi:DNA ligase 1
MTRKVQRPKGWDPKKIKFQDGPVWNQPKIDGCRAYNPEGTLLARTQKLHNNAYTTGFYSRPEYVGMDGELAAERETHPDLCRITSSALRTAEGTPFTLWWLFDFITDDTVNEPYSLRYELLKARVAALQAGGFGLHLRVVPYDVCNNLAELEASHQKWVGMGYEGSCFYNPRLPHKEGDSSPTHGGVNRIKDFVDFEAEVLSFEEGQENLNEAQINELGRQFRTSHQENKIGNGMIGNMKCRMLADVLDPNSKKKVVLKDQIFTCSPGEMPHDERLRFFANPDLILKQTIKGKLFPKGIKDAPRFATYSSIRSQEDL